MMTVANQTGPQPPPLTLAVVICTRNRPHDLARCLASIARQSRLPDEVVIVDASDSEVGDRRSEVGGQGSATVVLRCEPGLPRQRNLALEYVKADVVAFFDDDVELAPDYLHELMAVYARRWPQGVGGVMGSEPGWRQSSGGAHGLKRLFGLTQVRAQGQRVRVLPSLGVVWVAQPTAEIPAEALVGFCMSYRRLALTGIRFDEALGGYADGEDVDVSLQVGRRYPLWQTPRAVLVHHRSRAARATLRRRFYTRARNEGYLHRKLMPQTLPYRLAWWWSALGRMLIAALVSLRRRTPGPFLGTVAGLRDWEWNTD